MSDTQTKILDCAVSLISERGYNAFSYKDIAKEIGIKTASIHYHYPSKADLGLAVVERYNEEFGSVLKAYEQKSSSGLGRIKLFAKGLIDVFDSGKGFCLCVSLAADETTLTPETSSAVCGFFDTSLEWLERCVVLAKAEGELRDDLHPSRTAMSLLSLFEGAMILARAKSSDKPLRTALKWAEEVLGVSQ